MNVFKVGFRHVDEGIQADNYVKTTRYTVLNFVPLTILENFKRIANLYFLLMAVIGFMPWSPIVPWVQVFPLVFVILISMMKALVEDLFRYFNDQKSNKSKFDVLRGQKLVSRPSYVITPGDIVRIKNNDEIPADLLVIASSEDEGTCYVNEVNLNGETALKQRKILMETRDLPLYKGATVSIPMPCKDLNNLDGRIDIGTESFSFGIKNCLLRGTFLKNTKWIIGISLYTGHDTRIIQNQRQPPHKTSHLERKLNNLIAGDFIVNLILTFALGIAGTYMDEDFDFNWVKPKDFIVNMFENVTSYALLLSYMIPISLYVTIEFVRFFQRWTFQLDLEMYDPELGFCRPNNSNLNEELGMVNHVFSDKTGTLTENKMEFVQFFTNGNVYNTHDSQVVSSLLSSDCFVNSIYLCITLCNSVVFTQNGFSSESPDEEALIRSSSDIGAKLISKDHGIIKISFNEDLIEYQHLATIEFSSDRKRMSVIVRDPNGKIICYTKGADSVMFSMASSSSSEDNISEIQNQVNAFACKGLRTLVCGFREIDQDEYDQWKAEYDQASLEIVRRDEKMAQIGSLIEHDIILLGALAIEDELQPYVAETIAFLSRMGIKIWVLTGDKMETAISIGRSTNVITERNELIIHTSLGNEERAALREKLIQSKLPVLVLSPSSLEDIIENDCELLVLAGDMCRSVICFRMSPFNKSKVVEVMRENTDKVCLAIGDGANDVGMIQSAHVGIGVFGREGHQAAGNSDFAITRFKHLKRLLCVHGRLSLVRISGVVLYMIAKNILLTFPQIWFVFFTNFSPTTVYDDFLLSTYNIVWTVFPPIIFGWFEQDVSPKSMMIHPQLYIEARAGRYMSSWRITLEILNVILQSVLLFYLNYYLPGLVIQDDLGFGGSFKTAGLSLFISIVLVANIQSGIRSHHWNVYLFLGIYLSIFLFFLLILPYGSFNSYIPDMYHVPQNVFTSYLPYCNLTVSVISALLPESLFRFLKAIWFPSYSRIIREKEVLQERNEK